MSLVVEAQRHAQQVKARLRNPLNAKIDSGIDLLRLPAGSELRMLRRSDAVTVRDKSADVFGPKLMSTEDMAFGPIVLPTNLIVSAIEDIQRAVCVKYKLTRLELISDRRTARIVRPRHIAIYLSRLLTPRSFPEIGRRFGGMDHTSILHAARKIERLRGEDDRLDAEIAGLIDFLTA